MDRLKTRALQSLQPLLTLALDEDIGPGDLTTDVLIDSEAEAEGRLIACAGGVVAGLLFVGRSSGASMRAWDSSLRSRTERASRPTASSAASRAPSGPC